MVIQRINPFLFGKVLIPPVTLDLGAASLIRYTQINVKNIFFKYIKTMKRPFKTMYLRGKYPFPWKLSALFSLAQKFPRTNMKTRWEGQSEGSF